MLSAALKVLGGKQDGKLIPLATKKFLIGREQDCHLRPNSDSVSRHHCVITIDDFAVHVRDLGSSNGTHINSVRIIGLREVKNGDRLRIGSLEFEFVCRKVAAVAPATPGGSEFSLDEFALPDAAPTEETAVMAKSDTVVVAPQPVSEPPATEPLPVEVGVSEVAAAMAVPEVPAPQPVPNPGFDQAAMAGGYPYGGQPQQFPGYGMPPQMQMPGYPYGMPQQPYPYMQQPGFMPQMYGMPYPQQGYPQPVYPGYPQPGYGYPQQPQMAPPPGGAEVPVEAAPLPASAIAPPPVQLPDPELTGAKPVEAKTDGGPPKPAAPNPAAEVLKKMMTRR